MPLRSGYRRRARHGVPLAGLRSNDSATDRYPASTLRGRYLLEFFTFDSCTALRDYPRGDLRVSLVGRVLCVVLVVLLVGEELRFTSGGEDMRASKFGVTRHSLLQALEQEPGRHLVMVHYSPEHDPHGEWVFNSADIDASPIAWGREMGPEQWTVPSSSISRGSPGLAAGIRTVHRRNLALT